MKFEMQVYRGLLRLYPRAFRQRYGEEMARVFQQSLEQQGSSFGFWTHVIWDALSSAGRERISGGHMTQTIFARLGAASVAAIATLYFGVGLIPLVIPDFSGVTFWFSELVAAGTVAFFVLAITGFALGQGRRPNLIEWAGYALIVGGFVLSMIRLASGERFLEPVIPLGMVVLGIGRLSQKRDGFAFKGLAYEGIAMVIVASTILVIHFLPQPDSSSWQALGQFLVGTLLLGLSVALWNSPTWNSSAKSVPRVQST